MRLIFRSLLLFSSIVIASAADAATWNVGCTNSVCPIINGDGKIDIAITTPVLWHVRAKAKVESLRHLLQGRCSKEA